MSLQVKAVLETLEGQKEKGDENGTLKLDITFRSDEKAQNNVWLILVADKSGSMSGNPWKQVCDALKYMLKESYETYTNITTNVIVYNQMATLLDYDEDNYERNLDYERAGGMTNFSDAYFILQKLLRSYSVGEETEVVIVFLTDGEDTTKKDPAPALRELKSAIDELHCSVVVHSVGFTKDHKFDVLNDLRMIGKEKGVFQYAEPGDGPQALQKKLEGIFDYVSLSGSKVQIQLDLDGHFFASGLAQKPIRTKDAVVRLEKDGTTSLVYSVIADSNAKSKQENPTVNVLLLDGSTPHRVSEKVERKITTGNLAVTKYKLNVMEQRVQEVVEKLSSHSSPPSDQERDEYLQVLKSVQQGLKEFDGPVVFRLPQNDREPIITQMSAMHARLGQLFETLAAWARGQWTTVNRARLADIAFNGVFTKANRQRRMDSRVATNAQRQKEDAAKLAALQLNTEKLSKATDESKALFSCILSLSNWVELAMDKDVIGFGLAVLRPEWVVDDPTQIRICNISTTFCAKSAIEDSIKYSIDVQGQVATTGGFGIGQEMGVATRGTGREPINAWLPLYIHSAHWDIIRINLRQILGYFVALDPLGFAADQVDAMFLVLGTMISRLTPTPGELQLKILFQFMLTCLAVTEEMHWFEKIEEKITSTIEKIHYDVTDQAKNLLVLVGYLVILPESRLEKLFKKPNAMANLWTAIMAIAARRSSFTMFNDLSEIHVRLFLDQILYGNKEVNYKPEAGGNTGEVVTNILGLNAAEDLTALLEFEKSYNPELITENMPTAVSQFSKAMNSYGYPTISALYSSLSFFFAWKDVTIKYPSPHPSVSLLVELEKTYGVAPAGWVEDMKKFFDAAYSSQSPSLNGYFTLLNSRYPLPHPINQVERAVVAQGVQYRVNKPAKEAFDRGVYMNTVESPSKCLLALHESLVSQRKIAFNSLAAAQLFNSLSETAIARQDVGMFAEDISKIVSGTRKTVAFKAIHIRLQSPSAPVSIPFAEFKLRVLITGKYPVKNDDGTVTEKLILDFGAIWIPGRVYMGRLERVFGHAEMEAIMRLAIVNNPLVWGR